MNNSFRFRNVPLHLTRRVVLATRKAVWQMNRSENEWARVEWIYGTERTYDVTKQKPTSICFHVWNCFVVSSSLGCVMFGWWRYNFWCRSRKACRMTSQLCCFHVPRRGSRSFADFLSRLLLTKKNVLPANWRIFHMATTEYHCSAPQTNDKPPSLSTASFCEREEKPRSVDYTEHERKSFRSLSQTRRGNFSVLG